MNATRLRLAGAARLLIGESRSFELADSGAPVAGFLLRHATGFVAYRNRCPHWGVDLDLGDERFYAPDVDRIYCKNHGALFRIADGVCDHGPCLGAALEPLPFELDGEDVWVSLKEAP